MLGLYVYEYDGAAGFWDLQIAETQWIDEGYSSEKYSFDGDYIWVTYERNGKENKDDAPMFHATYIRSQGYDVEYSKSGNVAGNHYQVMRGVYAVDPTAQYDTAKAALDVALANDY